MACEIRIADDAAKYARLLDGQTKKRIARKLQQIAEDPLSIRLSKPLQSSEKRSARVGAYRILFVLVPNPDPDRIGELMIVVKEIGPRGQVYRDA